jgi:hypothetical protein
VLGGLGQREADPAKHVERVGGHLRMPASPRTWNSSAGAWDSP